LAAGQAIDLRSQLGDAVLVGVLHVRLSGDQPGEEVVAEREIGGGGDRPYRHDHEGADHGPEQDRAHAHLAAGVAQRVVGWLDGAGAAAVIRVGAMAAVIRAMTVRMTRPVRHRRSRADPNGARETMRRISPSHG